MKHTRKTDWVIKWSLVDGSPTGRDELKCDAPKAERHILVRNKELLKV